MVQECASCTWFGDCLFSTLDPKELRELFACRRRVHLTKNTVVYPEGVAGNCVFFLCKGTVSLISDTDKGSRRIASFVRAGEIFGLDCLLPDNTRRFSAVTREQCQAISVNSNDFSRLLRSNPRFLWRFTTVLNLLLHKSQQRQLLLSGERVHNRLANALLECSLVSELKQVELAQLLGIPAETVSRELKKLPAKKKTNKRRESSTSPAGSGPKLETNNDVAAQFASSGVQC